MNPGYCIDTNIIIDGQRRRYPPTVFLGLWENIGALVAEGRMVCPREVLRELESVDDECFKWAKDSVGLIVEATDATVAVVEAITLEFPNWSSKDVNWADPWVIAEAEIRGWAVVTQERWSNSSVMARLRIPNICASRTVACLNFVEMMEREGWTFPA